MYFMMKESRWIVSSGALRFFERGCSYRIEQEIGRWLVGNRYAAQIHFNQRQAIMTSLFLPRRFVLVEPPASEPVTLAEAKLFLRVDGNEEDGLISRLIGSCRQQAEQWMRRSLVTQIWRMEQSLGGQETVPLALGPVQSVEGVTLIVSGQSQTLSATLYEFNAVAQTVTPAETGVADHVHIVYTAGYGDPVEVPTAIKQGILLMVAHHYHERESAEAIPAAATALWEPYRERSL